MHRPHSTSELFDDDVVVLWQSATHVSKTTCGDSPEIEVDGAGDINDRRVVVSNAVFARVGALGADVVVREVCGLLEAVTSVRGGLLVDDCPVDEDPSANGLEKKDKSIADDAGAAVDELEGNDGRIVAAGDGASVRGDFGTCRL